MFRPENPITGVRAESPPHSPFAMANTRALRLYQKSTKPQLTEKSIFVAAKTEKMALFAMEAISHCEFDVENQLDWAVWSRF